MKDIGRQYIHEILQRDKFGKCNNLNILIQERNTCIPNKIPKGVGLGVWEGVGMNNNLISCYM